MPAASTHPRTKRALFISQGLHRIAANGAKRKGRYRTSGNKENKECTEDEWKQINIDAVGEAVEPAVHDEPCSGPCQHVAHEQQYYDFTLE